jgi:hypothetical protein
VTGVNPDKPICTPVRIEPVCVTLTVLLTEPVPPNPPMLKPTATPLSAPDWLPEALCAAFEPAEALLPDVPFAVPDKIPATALDCVLLEVEAAAVEAVDEAPPLPPPPPTDCAKMP